VHSYSDEEENASAVTNHENQNTAPFASEHELIHTNK
jgi:hypothetical protein